MFAHNYLPSTAKSDKIALDTGIIKKALMIENIRGPLVFEMSKVFRII